MIKTVNKMVKCSECLHSKMNGMDLVCTEFNEVIYYDEVLCTTFEPLAEEAQ